MWLTGSEKTLGFTEICASRIVNNVTLKQIYENARLQTKKFLTIMTMKNIN